MKIELKKIYYSEQLSEETSAFTADVYVNGKKLLYAKNDGHGGCTDYNTYDPADRPFLKEVEDYCLTLPPVPSSFGGTLKMDLEFKIDTLLHEYLDKKDEKKKQNDLKKGICYKTNNGYNTIAWKGHTLSTLLAIPNGRKVVKEAIIKLKSEGKEIINTNLTEFA